MKKIIIIVVGILILAAGFGFWFFVKNKPAQELIASGHPAWPPIMYQEGNQIVGAGPEIVEKIFTDLGIKVVFKYEGAWDIVQDKAKNGLVDVLAAAYKTAERETYMDYSIPYTVDPVVLVVKKGKVFSYDKWDDLLNKTGVVTIGDSYGQDFDNFIQEKLNPIKVSMPEEAFALLEKEEADYFIYALYSAEDYIFQNKLSSQVEIIPKYASTENFYLTISKKSPFAKLMPQVNSLLEKYKNDATIEQIIEKHKQSLRNKDEAAGEIAVQIANPASVNCSKLGGNLVIQKNSNGGEYGVCFFEDNRQCEEWALFRGACPVGGLKITGYENNAEIFCVITGGEIEGLDTDTPMCKRTDGTICTAQANFNGECPDPSNPTPNAGNMETQ